MLSFSDQTEILGIQEVRSQNDKLNSLTASVSHDMMTPLKCIVNYAQYLLTIRLGRSDREKVICILRTA